MARPVLGGLMFLAGLMIFLYSYHLEDEIIWNVKKIPESDSETKNGNEGWSWTQVLWCLVGGFLTPVLYNNLGKFVLALKSSLLAVWRKLGLEPRMCSYCLAQGAGEGVGQQGEHVWLCPTCR